MKTLRMLTMGIVTLGTAVALYRKMAEEKIQAPVQFINAIAEKGTAEIEAAKLALEKSGSTEVKAFAYEMIDDHTALNKDLRQLARNKGYEMPEEVDMVSRDKELLLSLRQEAEFDVAYAAHQISAHEKALAITKKASQLDDFDVSNFASKATHKLQHHLQMAQDLKKHLQEGPLKPGGGSKGATHAKGTWPLNSKGTETQASEPRKGDTPTGKLAGDTDDADISGGATPKTPAAGKVTAESNVASQLAKEDDSGLSKGMPQEVRGNSKNPGH